MNEKTLSLIREKGKYLIENWDSEFADRAEFWDHGPSKFFYEEVMRMHRERDIQDLLFDREFYVCIYAALTAWGLDRMGKGGPKMRDFPDFKQEIERNSMGIVSLAQLQIGTDAGELERGLVGVFNALEIPDNKNKTKIVANSKTLHFLLPFQAPIVDREYIMRYFLCRDLRKYPNLSPGDESGFYFELVRIYYGLLGRYPVEDKDPLRVIDKAVVNYVRRKIRKIGKS